MRTMRSSNSPLPPPPSREELGRDLKDYLGEFEKPLSQKETPKILIRRENAATRKVCLAGNVPKLIS